MTGNKWISMVKLISSIPQALGFIPRARQRKNDKKKKVMSRKLYIPMPEDDV